MCQTPVFNPAYMPPLPPPVNFAMDDIIGNQMTLGAVAHSSDPAPPYDLVLTPVGLDGLHRRPHHI